MKRGLISVALCALLIAGGVGVTMAVAGRASDETAEAAPLKEKVRRNVAIEVVAPSTVYDRFYISGRIEPWESVTLSAETRGKIEWQGVEEGDIVQQGQELFKINRTSIEAQLDQARADVSLAEQELERARSLQREGLAATQEYERAMNQQQSAQAALQLLEIDFAKSVIAAPWDGVVDRLDKEAGEFVDVGADLVHLVQVDKVKALLGVPEREITYVAPGAPVALRLDAYPEQDFDGTVYRIGTSADAVTRTFPVEVAVLNPDGLLMPGMLARGAIVRTTYPEAITVPLFAVVSRADGRVVFVEEGGTVHATPVDLGAVQGDRVHVLSGLASGDRVVVLGQRELTDGEAVQVQDAGE
ncbi:MAG: efflux RND transporter periplasmic adaptor subunit [Candidatus Hydrogenedentales bacterium]